jgi:hypothetical protein
MRVTVSVKKFYDWEPVPGDVVVTQQDISSEKVKPAANGGWLMKVTKNLETHTQVNLPEEQIIAKIIHDRTRPEGGRVLTRKQAVAFYLSENVMPHHAHRSWITGFEVHDDGPDEKMARAMLAPHTVSETARLAACKDAGKHKYISMVPTGKPDAKPVSRCVSCGHVEGNDTIDAANIELSDVEAHIKAYMEPADAKAHEDLLHAHFKVKPSSSAVKEVGR